MSQASPELVWQVIKKGNAFLRKGSNGRGDPIFSAEKGNLYARHSFKFSGAPLSLFPGAARGGGAVAPRRRARRASPARCAAVPAATLRRGFGRRSDARRCLQAWRT